VLPACMRKWCRQHDMQCDVMKSAKTSRIFGSQDRAPPFHREAKHGWQSNRAIKCKIGISIVIFEVVHATGWQR
jgi:hypothetical protein